MWFLSSLFCFVVNNFLRESTLVFVFYRPIIITATLLSATVFEYILVLVSGDKIDSRLDA